MIVNILFQKLLFVKVAQKEELLKKDRDNNFNTIANLLSIINIFIGGDGHYFIGRN
jgi:hypothetical protein